MNVVSNAALVGSLAVIGGGVVGVLAGSIARGNLSEGVNGGLTPIGVMGMLVFGGGTTASAGWATFELTKHLAPGHGRNVVRAGGIAGVVAVAAAAAFGGYQVAKHD